MNALPLEHLKTAVLSMPMARTLGLPERPRWALERYLVQRLLAQEGAAELSLALDPDASWPALAAVAERITAWLEAR